ncbi:hypothetical protein, partial [Pseudomonas sp.]|uniref:hypothetical protein n=1 Tax=Pseudomonas sp. TaxID=306 RepID=UPI0028B2679D
MHSTQSKPSLSSFWLLAFGFWLLAFGFWLLEVGFQIKSTFIRHGGAESAFRLYGDLLFDCGARQGSCRVWFNRFAFAL